MSMPQLSSAVRCRVDGENAGLNWDVLKQCWFDRPIGLPRCDPCFVGEAKLDIILKLLVQSACCTRVKVGFIFNGDYRRWPLRVTPSPPVLESSIGFPGIDDPTPLGAVNGCPDVSPGKARIGDRIPIPRPVRRCVSYDPEEVLIKCLRAEGSPLSQCLIASDDNDCVPPAVTGPELSSN